MIRRVGAALLGLVSFVVLPSCTSAQTEIRVATYNVQWLDAEDLPAERRQKLQEIVTLLEADVIGLQEIDDRAALEEVFTESGWQLVIDDDSGERQDLALVVRQPLQIQGLPSNLDAEADHFLFPDTLENLFPDRRDVLAVEVGVPQEDRIFTILVHHAKSRFERNGGRATTDHRREGAAVEIVRLSQSKSSGE